MNYKQKNNRNTPHPEKDAQKLETDWKEDNTKENIIYYLYHCAFLIWSIITYKRCELRFCFVLFLRLQMFNFYLLQKQYNALN